MSVISYSVLEGEKIEKAKNLKQRHKGFLPNLTKAIIKDEMYFTNHTPILKEIKILKENIVFALYKFTQTLIKFVC